LLAARPQQMPELTGLQFRAEQTVVSFLAGTPIDQLRPFARRPARPCRALPCVSLGQGPILMTPSNPTVEALFNGLGDLIVLSDEANLTAAASITGLMSSHFELQNVAIDWLAVHCREARRTRMDWCQKLKWTLILGPGVKLEKRHRRMTGAFKETLSAIQSSTSMFWQKKDEKPLLFKDPHGVPRPRYAVESVPNRRQINEELKLARSNELAALTATYQNDKQALSNQHCKEREDDRIEMLSLRKEAIEAWDRWREEFDVPEVVYYEDYTDEDWDRWREELEFPDKDLPDIWKEFHEQENQREQQQAEQAQQDYIPLDRER
jgi:hypothetical protein